MRPEDTALAGGDDGFVPVETNEQWYERERAAFIAWWESEGQKKFSETPTLAAGAGWLARADAARSATRRSST